VYEVVYEVRNRPDWVDIPLAAVAALAGSSVNGSSTSNGQSHHPAGQQPRSALRQRG
jgi:hypothetical protein